jgi:RsiW-degrading membrane proteinase PrsW (M82 family)
VSNQDKKSSDLGTLILVGLAIAAGSLLLFLAYNQSDSGSDTWWMLGGLCLLGGAIMGVIRAQTDRIVRQLGARRDQ